MTVLALVLLAGCIENTVTQQDPVPVADPPGDETDGLGQPPDWQDCRGGWVGRYHNLGVDDPAVGPDAPAPVFEEHPSELGWWNDDNHVFTRFDPAVDFGSGWWPVDEGLLEDPAWFAVSWNAWLRVWDGGDVRVMLAGADDAWLVLRGEVVGEAHSTGDTLLAEDLWIDLDPGQYPIELYYAHRTTPASGFRFRILEGDVSLCYPDYSEPEE